MNDIEKNGTDEIVNLHGEIAGLLKLSLDKAIRIGELLAEQKASLKHGDFIPWVKANLPFTERTAQNYMRLYNNREQFKNENVSHLADGYRLLQGPSKPAKNKSLLEQQNDLAKRRIDMQRAAGGAMIEINRLLKPTTGHSIVGTADGDIVFHIEGTSLIVFTLKGEYGQGFTEQRYATGGDLWWHLDNHVGIGRVKAIWQEAEMELTDEEIRRFEQAADMDSIWDIAEQIIRERKCNSEEEGETLLEAMSRLYDSLMSAYGRLCEACEQLMGTDVPAAVK